MTLPMIVGMFSIVAFNAADVYFVGQLGTAQLAAIGFTFPVVITMGSIAMGIGMGAGAVISRAIGQGDPALVRRLTVHALVLALLIVAVLSTIGLTVIEPTFRLLGADGAQVELIAEYMTVWYVGMIFLVVPMVGNNAIRASGDTLRPGLIMVLGALINVALDPLLIFGLWGLPTLGIRGAAVATVIGRACTMIVSLAILHFDKRMLESPLRRLSTIWDSWKRILHIGIPAAATALMYPITIAVITRLVAEYGEPAVGATGAGLRLEAFAVMVIWATASALLPFVGQNWGAGQIDRVRRASKYTILFSVGWGLLCAAVLAPLARPIATAFSDEPAVVRHLTWYFRILPIGYGMRGVCILATTGFNALHRPRAAAILNIVRLLVGYIGLSALGGVVLGLYGIYIGISIANLLSGVLGIVWLWRAIRSEQAAADRDDGPPPSTPTAEQPA